QTPKADKREHVPVRRGVFKEGEPKIKREDGQTEPNQIQHLELLPGPPPIRDDRPGDSEKEQWGEKEKMRGEKSERFGGMQAGRFVETSARFQVAHRGPGVLRVPDDGRERSLRVSVS